MALVTVDEVKEIIDTSLTDDQITAFINMAATLVTDKLSTQTCLSTEMKKEIEKLLSAHFLSIRERRVKSEKIGDASVTYDGTTGAGLNSTLYGQQAIILDCSNTLVNLGKINMEFEVVDYYNG